MHRRTSSEIELAMVGYFNFSDEASEICRQFLTNIKNAQSNYISMGCFLATISDSVAATDGAVATTAAPPPSCGATRSATRSSFRRVHDMYSSILRGIKVAVGERREERGSGVGGEEEAGAPAARAERRGRRRHGGAAREDGRRGGERGARRQGKEGCRGRCSERPASARPFPAGRRSEGGQAASGGWGRRSGGWGRR
uniref:Uncharacterized protein n=1 Tax=Oryza rufipogon TaxID=4529 RepID=A0A0E0RFS4_ORYRU